MKLKELFTGRGDGARELSSTATNNLTKDSIATNLIERWNRVLSVNPSDKNARLQLLDAYSNMSEWQQVDSLIESLRSDFGDDYPVLLSVARATLKKEGSSREREIWEALHKQHPDEIDPVLGLARASVAGDESEVAMSWIDKALEIDPHDNRARLVKGKIRQRNNRTEEAIEIYSSILNSEPQHYEAEANLSSALFKLERYKELLERLKKSIDQHPDQPVFKMFLFRTYAKLKNHEEALSVINELLAQDTKKHRAEYYIEKTELLIRLDRANDADAVCESAINLYPDNIKLLTLYARVGQKKMNAA